MRMRAVGIVLAAVAPWALVACSHEDDGRPSACAPAWGETPREAVDAGAGPDVEIGRAEILMEGTAAVDVVVDGVRSSLLVSQATEGWYLLSPVGCDPDPCEWGPSLDPPLVDAAGIDDRTDAHASLLYVDCDEAG